MKRKKVLVSGCFDCLHSGHVAFLKSAARYGDLYVCIGNDANILQLKQRSVYQTENERLYMVSALAEVMEARVSSGMGMMDFVEDLEQIQPDVFVVNEDGHHEDKQKLCNERGIEYIVLNRLPEPTLPPRSTTDIRKEDRIPYRLDLAGGWLDQPYVSSLHPGAVITISVHVDFEVNARSGMASSTHEVAKEIWGHQIPAIPNEKAAKILFACDNPPGKLNISGSQDAIGIVFPGLNKLYYEGEYWPTRIDSKWDEDMLLWLESHLFLIPIPPRPEGFEVLAEQHLTKEFARDLAMASEDVWNAILQKDLEKLGSAMTASLMAQCKMFPMMWTSSFDSVIAPHRSQIKGYKISGAGGGGYIVVVSDDPKVEWERIHIKRVAQL